MSKEVTTNAAPRKKWLDELTLELRLNDFSGTAVGDALATVEEFLADSGQEPLEAFGTPREYASELAAESPKKAKESLRGIVTLGVTSLAVFLLFSSALTPWSQGEQLLIGGVQMACTGLAAVLILLLPLYLTFMVRNFWTLLAIPFVGGALGILPAIFAPKVAGEALLVLSAGPVVLATSFLLIALSAVGTVMTLRTDSDAITNPLRPSPAVATVKARWFEILTQWLFPIIALFLLGLTAMINAVSP